MFNRSSWIVSVFALGGTGFFLMTNASEPSGPRRNVVYGGDYLHPTKTIEELGEEIRQMEEKKEKQDAERATSQPANGAARTDQKKKRNLDILEREIHAMEAGLSAKQKEREAKFKKMMTEVVMLGSWQMTNAEGLEGKAPLSPPRSDRYVIKGVSKGLMDNWVITARVQFADRDVELPFNIRVVWAEETPIITMDKTALPMLGTYSARVMIDNGFYAGTWFGAGYGGVMQGQIVKAADEKLVEEKAKQAAKMKLPPKPTTKPGN